MNTLVITCKKKENSNFEKSLKKYNYILNN